MIRSLAHLPPVERKGNSTTLMEHISIQRANRSTSPPTAMCGDQSIADAAKESEFTILQAVIFCILIFAITLIVFTTMEAAVFDHGWHRFLLSLLLIVVAIPGILWEYTHSTYYLAAFYTFMIMVTASGIFYFVLAITSHAELHVIIFLACLWIFMLTCLVLCLFFPEKKLGYVLCCFRRKKKAIVASQVTAATPIKTEESSDKSSRESPKSVDKSSVSTVTGNFDAKKPKEYSRYDETGTNKSIRGTHNKKSSTKSEGSSAESIIEYNNVTLVSKSPKSPLHHKQIEMNHNAHSRSMSSEHSQSEQSQLAKAVRSPAGLTPVDSGMEMPSSAGRMRYMSPEFENGAYNSDSPAVHRPQKAKRVRIRSLNFTDDAAESKARVTVFTHQSQNQGAHRVRIERFQVGNHEVAHLTLTKETAPLRFMLPNKSKSQTPKRDELVAVFKMDSSIGVADPLSLPEYMDIPPEEACFDDEVTAYPNKVFFPHAALSKKTIAIINWSRDISFAIRLTFPVHGPYFVRLVDCDDGKNYCVYKVLAPRCGAYFDLYKKEDPFGYVAGQLDDVDRVRIDYISCVDEYTEPCRVFCENVDSLIKHWSPIYLNAVFVMNRVEFDKLEEINFATKVDEMGSMKEIIEKFDDVKFVELSSSMMKTPDFHADEMNNSSLLFNDSKDSKGSTVKRKRSFRRTLSLSRLANLLLRKKSRKNSVATPQTGFRMEDGSELRKVGTEPRNIHMDEKPAKTRPWHRIRSFDHLSSPKSKKFMSLDAKTAKAAGEKISDQSKKLRRNRHHLSFTDTAYKHRERGNSADSLRGCDRSRSPERKFVINQAPGPNSGYHWLYDLPDDAQFDRGEERDVLRQDNIIKRTASLPRLATSTPKMGYDGRGRGVGLSDTPKSISAPKFATNNPNRVYEDGCVRKSAWYVESDGVLKEKHGWAPATPTSFLQHTFSNAPSPIIPEGTPKGVITGSDSTEFDPDPSRGRSKSRSRQSHRTPPASPKEENRLPKPEELSNRPDGSALIKWLAHARNNPADTAARPRELLIPAEAVREGDLVTAVPDRYLVQQILELSGLRIKLSNNFKMSYFPLLPIIL
ncbi:hypothetical protein WR25_06426 [Diploscapter pachys]|uniref:Uncharacterized protein n=1 Tax=Diploscapter pachys TaxID=2018661 RepID=A0A2A2K8Y6_9BILA|nr:hypothetical protein WR25_06426 [Diploscapter pachys]